MTTRSSPNSTGDHCAPQQFTKAGDFESFMAADNEFHAQLYAATDKQDIYVGPQPQRAYRPVGGVGCTCPLPARRRDIVRHHKLIAKAIGAGQPGRCAEASAHPFSRARSANSLQTSALSGISQQLSCAGDAAISPL
jgi:DNA-binding GntR family transcriptional regulator